MTTYVQRQFVGLQETVALALLTIVEEMLPHLVTKPLQATDRHSKSVEMELRRKLLEETIKPVWSLYLRVRGGTAVQGSPEYNRRSTIEHQLTLLDAFYGPKVEEGGV